MKRSERAVLVGLVTLIGVALRVGFLATSQVEQPLRADAGQYAQYAHNLLEHGTFSLDRADEPAPDSFRSPGYPAFVAACGVVGGEHWYDAVRWLQGLLGALLVPLAYWLARSVLSFAPALLVAALTALSPHLVVSTGYVLTEALAAPLLLLAFWLLSRAQRKPTAAAVVGAGVAFGAAVLVNEALAPLMLLLSFLQRRRLGRGRALLLAVCALLPFAAWTVRNQTTELARSGQDRAIASLSHGTYPGLFFATEEHRYEPYREDPEQPEFGQSWQRLGEVFLARAGADPWRYLRWYVLEKPLWVWGWDIVQGAGSFYVYPVHGSLFEEQPVVAATAGGMRALHWPLSILCLLGAVWALPRRREVVLGRVDLHRLRPLAVTLFWFTAIYTLCLPDPRYLVPLRPLQYVLAVAALTALCQLPWRALRGRARRASSSDEDGGDEANGADCVELPPVEVPEPVAPSRAGSAALGGRDATRALEKILQDD